MEKHFEVIVIGAGAIGGSVSYYLSEKGISVCLLDENAIGSGASAHATGFLSNTYDYDSNPNINDALFDSSELFDVDIPKINDLSQINTLAVTRPGLRLALSESDAAILKNRADFSKFRNRYPFDLLTGDETRKLDKRLSENILAAGYIPEETQIDSYKFTLALAVAAEKLGAEINQRKVVGLIYQSGKVTGVQCSSEVLYADNIVVSGGLGSNSLLSDIGINANLSPLKGQSIRMKYSGQPLGFHIGGVESWHLINRGDDLISAGSTSEFNNFEESPNHQATQSIMEWVMSVMPSLEDAQIVETMYGFRPMSPDNLPIVGPVDSIDNVYLATGHGHKGIHLSLLTGKIITDLISRGYSEYNWDFMNPNRFASNQ
tara:strand:+ start:10185 stop:11309 length:1125 start_codon:yes stop_codon:yes gene_type:complete